MHARKKEYGRIKWTALEAIVWGLALLEFVVTWWRFKQERELERLRAEYLDRAHRQTTGRRTAA